MFTLKPTNTKFYDYFEQVADLSVQAAARCHAYFRDGGTSADAARTVKDLEHKADDATHAAMELLHRSFITPIDRGDIRRLIQSLDDVIDLTDATMGRVSLYGVGPAPVDMVGMARVLEAATKVVLDAVRSLRDMRRRDTILQHCVEVHRLENESDRYLHEGIVALFKLGLDPLSVIKWKEIIETLEEAVDRCEDVANLVEGIVLENA